MNSLGPQQSRFDIFELTQPLKGPKDTEGLLVGNSKISLFVTKPYYMGVYELLMTPAVKIWHFWADPASHGSQGHWRAFGDFLNPLYSGSGTRVHIQFNSVLYNVHWSQVPLSTNLKVAFLPDLFSFVVNPGPSYRSFLPPAHSLQNGMGGILYKSKQSKNKAKRFAKQLASGV